MSIFTLLFGSNGISQAALDSLVEYMSGRDGISHAALNLILLGPES